MSVSNSKEKLRMKTFWWPQLLGLKERPGNLINTNVTCHSTGAYNRVKKWRPVCCETLQLSRVITADSESHKALWQAYDFQQRNKTNKETTKTDRSGTLAAGAAP